MLNRRFHGSASNARLLWMATRSKCDSDLVGCFYSLSLKPLRRNVRFICFFCRSSAVTGVVASCCLSQNSTLLNLIKEPDQGNRCHRPIISFAPDASSTPLDYLLDYNVLFDSPNRNALQRYEAVFFSKTTISVAYIFCTFKNTFVFGLQ